MKLARIQQKADFDFALFFENGEVLNVNLEPLISSYISAEDIGSAEIDPDWGCLQFNGGAVDIEPKTLYQFAIGSGAQAA